MGVFDSLFSLLLGLAQLKWSAGHPKFNQLNSIFKEKNLIEHCNPIFL